MAQISRFLLFRHLRAEPNQYILHYRGGKLIRQGAGLAYWFYPLSASIAQVPTHDIETTFVVRESSADFQEFKAQITLIYRISAPQQAANRINFALAARTGNWIEQPLEKLANLWAKMAQQPVRLCLSALSVVEAVQTGAARIQESLVQTMNAQAELKEMGLHLVQLQVDQLTPASELERALQTPTREAIQQKADEASFQRRALAVEKERAIKENELATQIELAKRQQALIEQEDYNQLLVVKSTAERDRLVAEAGAQRQIITARATAEETELHAQGKAAAGRLVQRAELEAETARVQLWRDTPANLLMGFALQNFSDKISKIEHLNLSPDLLSDSVQRLLLNHVELRKK